jgi:type IV pilus assembly protein PilW
MKLQSDIRLHQNGFTIVEILVAVTISLILLMGVINIFLAGKQSYTLQSGMSRLQENARFALDMMATSISLAGRDTSPNFNVLPFGPATSDGGGNFNDIISVQYFAPTDCLGANTAGNAIANVAVDTFSIVGTQLTCNGTAVVDGIDNMQILYGMDRERNTNVPTLVDGIPESYDAYPPSPYTAIDPPDDLDENRGGVASVRIALLVSSVMDPNAQMTSKLSVNTTAYSLLDAPALPAFNDQRLRRVFSRTILLRNYFVQPKNPSY